MFLLYIKRNIFFTQWLYGYVKVTLKLSCKDIPGSMISREGRLKCEKKKTKKKREFKGPWHASAHVRHFDFWSSEPFFKIGFWRKNPFPLTLRRPRKLLYQYSRAIWFILEVLNAIFCILRQHFRSHWGEVHEGILFVVSVPTNGSNVAFNVVIWLSFLSIKFSSQRSTFFG